MPRDKNNGLITIPPAIPSIPDKILAIKHIVTTLKISLGFSKCRSLSSYS